MPFLKAFDGFLVRPEHAKAIVSPAYDSVSPEQRREFAQANPDNFINTMRLREDFPEQQRPTYDDLLLSNQQHLQQLLHKGFFRELPEPGIFIYQFGPPQHLQTGIVAEVSVEDYKNGSLKRHENTTTAKEDLLANYQQVVGASSSPICLTYAQNHAIDSTIAGLMHHPPDLDFTTADGEIQRVWRVIDPDVQHHLQQLFEQVGATYLTDGHHRAASGLRYAERMQKRHGNQQPNAPYNQLLVALFPDNQLNLLPFHRSVRDLNGLSTNALINALAAKFDVININADDIFIPTMHGEFGMWLDHHWYQLKHKTPAGIDADIDADPVQSLDVTILQNDILDPILGISDMRDDSRLGYIAGISGDDGIRQACDEGWQIIFTCYATSIQQLMKVADAESLMPPKSTYFDPKPRSGIFVRLK